MQEMPEYRTVQEHDGYEALDYAARIKVVGVGGGGCNAVDRMVAEGVQGVDFVAVNTDAQALLHSDARTCLQIGGALTRGLGSGGDPLVGQKAAEESHADIAAQLKGADMVFITGGMGGGTGTGAAPIIAGIAQDIGILTVAIVSLPFSFEGNHRRKMAEQGIEQLRPLVDTLIVVPNERLLQFAARQTSMLQAFRMADQVLLHGIQGITDLIIRPGLINVDFADVRAIMACAGSAWMAIGTGTGSDRVVDAVQQALSSPLLETSIAGARGVLCNIVGGEDIGLGELSDGIALVTETVDPDANIIFGAVTDQAIMSGEVKVTLIATGFEQGTAQPQPQTRHHTRPAHSRPQPARPMLRKAAQLQEQPQRPGSPAAQPAAEPEPETEPAEQPQPAAEKLPVPVRAAMLGGDDIDLTMPPFLRNRALRRQNDS